MGKAFFCLGGIDFDVETKIKLVLHTLKDS